MKKILLPVILGAILLTFPACSSIENSSSVTNDTDVINNIGTKSFDMEKIRKSIIVRGERFEIPVKLNELADGLTYELLDDVSVEGKNTADIYRNGENLCTVGVKDCFAGAESDGEIYYISLNNDECSADGIIPFKTTMQEVLDKYGEPGYKIGDDVSCIFYYSENKSVTPLDGLSGNTVAISFEDNKVATVSITYV